MKILYNIYFILFLISFLAFSCNDNRSINKNSINVKDSLKSNYPIPDSSVYEVINYLISNKEVNPNIKSNVLSNKWDGPFLFYFKNDSVALTKLDTLFSEEDISFIFSQKEQFNKFVIDPKLIKSKEVILLDSLSNSKYKTFSSISFPLFNRKRDIVIIATSYYCGALCAYNGIYIYQKKNSKWILLKVIQESIS